jgi:hypothetical protein
LLLAVVLLDTLLDLLEAFRCPSFWHALLLLDLASMFLLPRAVLSRMNFWCPFWP